MRAFVLGATLLLAASGLYAHPASVKVIPAAPTTQDLVKLEMTGYYPCCPITVRREGNTLHVVVPYWENSGIMPPAATWTVDLGYLRPGDYVINVYEEMGFRSHQLNVTVADAGAPFVPAVSSAALIAMSIAMAAAGWFCLAPRS